MSDFQNYYGEVKKFLENVWMDSFEEWQARYHCKLVFVCGGVISGLGKGILTSSLAVAYKLAGYDVSVVKIDPYLVKSIYKEYLDIGNYERFLDIDLANCHSLTSGRIYLGAMAHHIFAAQGKTIQFIPHITDRFMRSILYAATIPVGNSEKGTPDRIPDIMFVEIGGTVGDYEGNVIYESIRQLRNILNDHQMSIIMLGYIPTSSTTKEHKTKPFQNSVRDLRTLGLSPDIVICRSAESIEPEIIQKLGIGIGVPVKNIFTLLDCKDILTIPMQMVNCELYKLLSEKLLIPLKVPDFKEKIRYNEFQKSLTMLPKVYKIAIMGKYSKLEDSYHSIIWALKHAALECGIHFESCCYDTTTADESFYIKNKNMKPDDAKNLAEENKTKLFEALNESDGVIVPGGFGVFGVNFKFEVLKYCREKKKPMLGICYGFQLATVEYARNFLKYEHAHTAELKAVIEAEEPNVNYDYIVNYIDNDLQKKFYGDKLLRLGDSKIIIQNKDSLAFKLYGANLIVERHRHRLEFQNRYLEEFEKNGMIFSGISDNGYCREILELKDHPFFFATQFHPELKSRPENPSRPFIGFILASIGQLEKRLEEDGGILKIRSPWKSFQI